MSLGTKLVQEAQKQAAMKRPFPLEVEATQSLAKGSEIKASAKIADQDRFSQMAEEVKVSVAGVNSRASAETKARRFAEKTTYLTEKLQYVETDEGGTATVRSTPQTMAGRGAPYYEAAVKGDEITLRRFQAQGKGREQQPFCVTGETLERIVDDAAKSLSGAKKSSE